MYRKKDSVCGVQNYLWFQTSTGESCNISLGDKGKYCITKRVQALRTDTHGTKLGRRRNLTNFSQDSKSISSHLGLQQETVKQWTYVKQFILEAEIATKLLVFQARGVFTALRAVSLWWLWYENGRWRCCPYFGRGGVGPWAPVNWSKDFKPWG